MTSRAKLPRFVLVLAWTLATRLFAPSSGLAADAIKTPAPQGHESPFACIMSALSPAERKQHFEEYGPRLRARLESIRELPNGYEFAFHTDKDTYQVLSTWMFQERLCCPFFDLELRIDREGGSTWLRLTGREGVKDFIQAEFEPWFRKGS
ncbi:MAG TPA: hypothetical protein VFR25_11325 [Candidatus Eisenbacteria bacterium]|nr:hypothetical protein [Candidatus Eisenbacteria bacterium]